MTNEERYAFEIYELITSLFDKNSDNYRYDLNEIDLTEFFTGILIASGALHERITKKDGDLFDFIHIQMRLAFQYIRKNEK